MSLKIDVRRLFILGMMVQLIGGYLARILANQHAHCTKCQNESTPWLVWVDDKPENIEAAASVGLQAVLFQSIGQLRNELEVRNLIEGLPVPGAAEARRS